MALTLPAAPGDGPVTIAFSGGMDSTVLLHLAAADPALRARGLQALHVDHGLHPDSVRWAEACARTCAQLGVAFAVRRVQVRDAGDGLEAAAREARHAVFAERLDHVGLVALAHHLDDQAETLLLRLMRGSGDGLGAMRALRPLARGWLWRPLLDVPQAALLEHARQHGLHWTEDPSNASPHHDRNFLRHAVLPTLQARWPHAAASLVRSASHLATQQALLAGEDARRLAQVQGLDPATLSVPALLAQPVAWRARLLRAWIAALGLPPLPGDAPDTIGRELLAAREDAQAVFAWSGAALHRWRDLLHAGPASPPLPGDWQATWTGTPALELPTGDTLALEPARPFATPLLASARRGGERITLPGRRHRSELKHVLQDLGVPPWERARLPLLTHPDGTVLAAGDLALSASLQAWLDDTGTRLRWRVRAR
jgi:tRNA(Ile)-lysidine synthase